jgi:hypothetical protein
MSSEASNAAAPALERLRTSIFADLEAIRLRYVPNTYTFWAIAASAGAFGLTLVGAGIRNPEIIISIIRFVRGAVPSGAVAVRFFRALYDEIVRPGVVQLPQSGLSDLPADSIIPAVRPILHLLDPNLVNGRILEVLRVLMEQFGNF